jgi:transcriptional regulator with XRE-family HTH domain
MVRVARRQPRTKIAARRLKLRLKQREVSELTGIPVRQLRRLEKGEIERPPLAYLVNLAMVLDVDDPLDLAEDEWIKWQVLDARAAEPPDRKHWLT